METKRAHRTRMTSSSLLTALAVIVLCGLVPSTRVVRAELFTALVDLELLLEAERSISVDLRQYVAKETERLQRLSRLADDMGQHSASALADPEHHLGNPVNAFLLIKRFTTDWERAVKNYIRNDNTDEFLASLPSKTERFPTSDDMTGAVEALLRLQDTYALSTEQISKGNLMGVRDSPKMTAHDCFQLASVSYTNQDYYHTYMWISEAMRVYETEVEKTIDMPSLLDYAAYSLYMQGNVKHALQLTNAWLKLEPNHVRAQNNKNYYIKMINEAANSINHQDSASVSESSANIDYLPQGDPVNQRPMDSYKLSHEYQTYEKLCRGEETQVNPFKDELICRYMRHHPMFYIRPVKEEVLYHNPRISMFHNVLTSSEMAVVRKLARPKLERSVVYHTGPAGTYTPQNYRISKSSWLGDWESPIVSRISVRAGAVANLTLESAEQMQVLNYGIGGHYEPHYDFSTRKEMGEFERTNGNRLATFLCYATNVTAGGATVFPQLGVQLWPELGSCVLWFNLYRSGEGDFNTRHAACPVLTGSKWVCNKWFRERGQEFIRQCATSASE